MNFETTHVSPLCVQMGVDAPKFCPDGLSRLLFGQADPALQTFALLDAARIPGLVEILAASDLGHRCLFVGDALDELGDVAPWLVELKPDHKFTQNLFTADDAPWAYWDAEPGIFLRAPGPLDAVRRHLRKSTRVPTESGDIQFFRFWEPAMARAHFEFLLERPDWYQDWVPRGFQFIIVEKSGDVAVFSAPDSQAPRSNTAFHITDVEIQRFKSVKRRLSLDRIALHLKSEFPDVADAELRSTTAAVADKFGRMGFIQLSSIYMLSLWDQRYGAGFERRDPDGILLSICQSGRDEALRLADLTARLKELDEHLVEEPTV